MEPDLVMSASIWWDAYGRARIEHIWMLSMEPYVLPMRMNALSYQIRNHLVDRHPPPAECWEYGTDVWVTA